jgi:hypothetical protein
MNRVPKLPDCLPQRGNAFSRLLGHAGLALAGWHIEGEFPPHPKMLAIVAPHTRVGFSLGICAVYALACACASSAAHTVQSLLGWLMRWLGGRP